MGGGGSEIYVVYFPQILKLVECLVDVYPERENNPGRLREHLMY